MYPLENELKQYTETEKANNARLALLTEQRNALYEAHLKALDEEIALLTSQVKDAKEAVKNGAIRYAQETGEQNFNPYLTVKRATRWEYDRAEALEFAKNAGWQEAIRVKEELVVDAFEEKLPSTEFPAAQTHSYTVTILSKPKKGF